MLKKKTLFQYINKLLSVLPADWKQSPHRCLQEPILGRQYLLMVLFLQNEVNFSIINNLYIGLRCKKKIPWNMEKTSFDFLEGQLSYHKRASNHLQWKALFILLGKHFVLQHQHWKPRKRRGAQPAGGSWHRRLFLVPDFITWMVGGVSCTHASSWRLDACSEALPFALARQS